MQALPALQAHAAKLRLRSSLRRVWGLSPVRWVLNPAGTASVLRLWGQTHSELPWLCEVERGKGGVSKAGASRVPRNAATGHPAAPKAQQDGPSR